MKILNKNSREEFNAKNPIYYKYSSMYGYLVLVGESIFFIVSVEDMYYLDLTDEFEILN